MTPADIHNRITWVRTPAQPAFALGHWWVLGRDRHTLEKVSERPMKGERMAKALANTLNQIYDERIYQVIDPAGNVFVSALSPFEIHALAGQ